MIIGINATAALKKERTGVEEYAYQIIKHLTMLEESNKHRFILYSPDNLEKMDMQLPENFSYKFLPYGKIWTQRRLNFELFKNMPQALFVPAHVLPPIHPYHSTVTIHGLEYEYYPKNYDKKQRAYLKLTTRYSANYARNIITVSEKTKNDLIDLYKINPKNIEVVYHGLDKYPKKVVTPGRYKYILYIGRIELKKNLINLVKSFEVLKEKYNINHKLILIGPKGFGSEMILEYIAKSRRKDEIFYSGYLNVAEKNEVLSRASVLVLPSWYEGFGLPIIEAMSYGIPIACSNSGAMPEIADEAAIYFDPADYLEIAQQIASIIKNEVLSDKLRKFGRQRAKNFHWEKSAQKTLSIITAI